MAQMAGEVSAKKLIPKMKMKMKNSEEDEPAASKFIPIGKINRVKRKLCLHLKRPL